MDERERVIEATIGWLEAYKDTNEEVMSEEDLVGLNNTINYWKEVMGE